MLKLKIGIISSLVLCTSCGIFSSKKYPVLPTAQQKMEYVKSLNSEFRDNAVTTSLPQCHVNSIYYNPAQNALFLLESNPDGEGVQQIYTLKYDKKHTKVSQMSNFALKAQNGQNLLSINAYQELVKKGKRPKFNLYHFSDMVYDGLNKTFVVLNRGYGYQNGQDKFISEPNIYNLSEDNRLMGMYAISRLFKLKDDSKTDSIRLSKMTISPEFTKLFTATAAPLWLERPDMDSYDTGFVRISKYRNTSRSVESQYLYPITYPNDPQVVGRSHKEPQLVNLLAKNDSVLWVMEGLELIDNTWEYKLYEVVLGTEKRLTSNKPIKELRRRPILDKKLIYTLNDVLKDIPAEIIDLCWGPEMDKKPSMYLLLRGDCLEERSFDIIHVKFH